MAPTSTVSEPSCGLYGNQLLVFDMELSASQNIIMTHGANALQSMQQGLSDLYRILGDQINEPKMWHIPEAPALLTELCTHAGIASNILFNVSERARTENAVAFKSRCERNLYVQRHCGEHYVIVSVLNNRSVRNRLMHPEQFLPSAFQEEGCGWFIDGVLSHRNIFDQEADHPVRKMKYFRTLIASEGKIIHLNSEISVSDLWFEAKMVLATVFGRESIEPPKALVELHQAPLNSLHQNPA